MLSLDSTLCFCLLFVVMTATWASDLNMLLPAIPGPMEELHSLDPRRQELLEARFTGAVSGNTGGSTGSTSGGAKVTTTLKIPSLVLIPRISREDTETRGSHESKADFMHSCTLTDKEF